MGGITSGVRGWRGGKVSVETLPAARLTHAQWLTMERRNTYVRTDGTDWGIVVHNDREWLVQLAFTPLHFGGQRRWLTCPECQAKREVLHIDGERLACRVCLNLRYASQHENHRERLVRRITAIRGELGWRGGIADPNGSKPARMHWATFERLVAEYERLVDALVGNIGQWIGRAERRLERLRVR